SPLADLGAGRGARALLRIASRPAAHAYVAEALRVRRTYTVTPAAVRRVAIAAKAAITRPLLPVSGRFPVSSASSELPPPAPSSPVPSGSAGSSVSSPPPPSSGSWGSSPPSPVAVTVTVLIAVELKPSQPL